MNLIIDVGNTRVKVAVFEGDMLVEVCAFKTSEIILELNNIFSKYAISHSIISTVAVFNSEVLDLIKKIANPLFLNATTKVPFSNLYETPTTLGVDRVALASAATYKYPNKNVLVIDAGTCITFDFIDIDHKYYGGAISPGIAMRYKALHSFTSKLPLLSVSDNFHFIGTNTEKAMHSGVVNGICQEIEGVISQYKEKYCDLTVVLTGGDVYFLAKQLKSGIFAHPNFVLEGLQTILTYNIAND